MLPLRVMKSRPSSNHYRPTFGAPLCAPAFTSLFRVDSHTGVNAAVSHSAVGRHTYNYQFSRIVFIFSFPSYHICQPPTARNNGTLPNTVNCKNLEKLEFQPEGRRFHANQKARCGHRAGAARFKRVDRHTHCRRRRDGVFEPNDVGLCEALYQRRKGEGCQGDKSDRIGRSRLLGADSEGEGEGVHI